MRIGVTSQNFRTITGHAGKTRRFLVYEGDPATGEVREIERIDLPKEMSLHEYRGGEPHPIESFDVLITAGCGQGFVGRMVAWGVQLHVTSETDPLQAARAVVRGEPLPPPLPHQH
ncbi:MAG TPA: nitrogen fixation protein [Sedimenticola thiotaurini]|uniref:Nitrogen fixation protein n=1 Tax=Sedimenticola thiotaurini TaxID=1543721 RepID=A0A831RI34_9GAMM|nr:nitrogen fixation protein [Sedimenticola thiotaurini]